MTDADTTERSDELADEENGTEGASATTERKRTGRRATR